MRKIVLDFIDNPRPKLRKRLTTMELKWALRQVEEKEASPEATPTKKTKTSKQNWNADTGDS